MAELTPEEKQKIYLEEKERLEARASIQKEKQKSSSQNITIGCLIVVLIVVVIIGVSLFSPSGKTPSTQKEKFSADTKSKIEAQVNESIRSGVIKKIDLQTKRAWIHEITWANVDSQTKEGIARNLALYFSVQKNEEYREANIIGWQSGRKLASYTSLGGFKVY